MGTHCWRLVTNYNYNILYIYLYIYINIYINFVFMFFACVRGYLFFAVIVIIWHFSSVNH